MHLTVDLWGSDEVGDFGLWDGWDRWVVVIDELLDSGRHCTDAATKREGRGHIQRYKVENNFLQQVQHQKLDPGLYHHYPWPLALSGRRWQCPVKGTEQNKTGVKTERTRRTFHKLYSTWKSLFLLIFVLHFMHGSCKLDYDFVVLCKLIYSDKGIV